MLDPETILYGRPNTVKTHRSLLRNHITPHLEEYMSGRTEEDVDEALFLHMLRVWEGKELKPGTIKQLLSLLKIYVKTWLKKEFDTARLTRTVTKMSPRTTVKAWTKEEAQKALDVARQLDPALWRMMLITLHTGIRKGELFGLKWEDIDFLKTQIRVLRSRCALGEGPTKNGEPRVIPMTYPVESMLLERYTVGSEGEFCFKLTDPNRRLSRICEIAEIRKISWHGIRHTTATLALEAGKSPRKVQAIMGHVKLSTLLDIYWNHSGEALDMDFLP